MNLEFLQSMTPPYKQTLSQQTAEDLAVNLAQFGLGYVTPNPVVGCVILDSTGQLVGTGYHQKFGGDHAEVAAVKDCLARFGETSLHGATCFVTLEPCGHVGKTPSCAHFLARYPFECIIYGSSDCNSLVSGAGVSYLQSKGVAIRQDKMWAETTDTLNEIFFHWIQKKTPFVAVKVATDNRGIMGTKDSAQRIEITPRAVQLEAHVLRQKYDAVGVGRQTVMIDNPRLTNRSTRFSTVRQPLRVVIDPDQIILKSGINYHILDESLAQTVFVTRQPIERSENKNLAIPFHGANFDLKNMLQQLNQSHNIYSILVEGGAQTLAQFFNQKLVQKFYHFERLTDLGLANPQTWSEYIDVAFSLERIRSQEWRSGSEPCALNEYKVRF